MLAIQFGKFGCHDTKLILAVKCRSNSYKNAEENQINDMNEIK